MQIKKLLNSTFINKLNYKVNNNTNIIQGFYLSKSSNIPRYDRLTLYDDIFTPKYSDEKLVREPINISYSVLEKLNIPCHPSITAEEVSS